MTLRKIHKDMIDSSLLNEVKEDIKTVNTRIEELRSQIGQGGYIHPDSHPASMIIQDANNRFVTDAEKITWNNKAEKTVATTSANGLMSSADKTKLNGITTGATKVEIVDDLDSVEIGKALSAKQGNELKKITDSTNTQLSNHLTAKNPHGVTTTDINYIDVDVFNESTPITSYPVGLSTMRANLTSTNTWNGLNTSYLDVFTRRNYNTSHGIQEIVHYNTSGMQVRYTRSSTGTITSPSWSSWRKDVLDSDVTSQMINRINILSPSSNPSEFPIGISVMATTNNTTQEWADWMATYVTNGGTVGTGSNSSRFVIETSRNGNGAVQTFTVISNVVGTLNNIRAIYVRGQSAIANNDAWGAWARIATGDDISNLSSQLANKADSTVVSTSANGLMSSADKNKLDGIEAGATKTTVVNNLTSTSTSSVLSAYQGKALNDILNSHIGDKNNPHGVTTEHVNFSSSKLITDAINTYPKGLTVFGLSQTEATTWRNSIDTSITGTYYGYVETIYAPNGSNGRGSQKVVFINASAVILGIYERGAYATTTWGSWVKTSMPLEDVLSVRTDTAPTSRLLRSTISDLVLSINATDTFVRGNMSNDYSAKKPIVLVQPSGYVENDIFVTTLNSNNNTQSYMTAIGAGTTITAGYTTAVGAGAKAQAQYASAIGAFSNSFNYGEGQIGTRADMGGSYNWIIQGNLSVGGFKNFEIQHPHPDKKHTHMIRHGAVESPTAGDTLYRFNITATEDNQTVEYQLPDYFEHLNTNVDVWVNGDKHFGRGYGEVIGDKLFITCENVGNYKVLAIGTRNDDNVQDWSIKGVEREIGESWVGETYSFEVAEIQEFTEFGEDY